MTDINLLPWRQIQQKESNMNFMFIVLFSVFTTALIMLVWYLSMNSKITTHQERNNYLSSELKIMEIERKERDEIKRQELSVVNKIKIIKKLQAGRSVVVRLFDEVVSSIPNNSYLTKITREGEIVHINGVASTNADVSEFMRNIDESSYLHDPLLLEIKTAKNKLEVNEYKLKLGLIDKEVKRRRMVEAKIKRQKLADANVKNQKVVGAKAKG